MPFARTGPSTLGRVLECVRLGFKGAIVLSVVAVIVAIGEGSVVMRLKSGREVYLIDGIAVYLAGGICAGAIVGALLPLARSSSVGAALVGIVAALPISYGTTVALGEGLWGKAVLIETIAFAILLGSVCGVSYRWGFMLKNST